VKFLQRNIATFKDRNSDQTCRPLDLHYLLRRIYTHRHRHVYTYTHTHTAAYTSQEKRDKIEPTMTATPPANGFEFNVPPEEVREGGVGVGVDG
jgi:hypothetical protein